MIKNPHYVTGKGLLAIATVTFAFASSSCSNAGKSSSTTTTFAAPVEPSSSSDAEKPSRIVFTLSDKISDVSGYIVGDAKHPSIQKIADQNGKPGFMNMSAGSYDIILEGQESGADGKLTPVALRISGLVVTQGNDTQVRDIALKPYITLSGTALISGEGPVPGVAITIPNTPFVSSTAADGTYSLKIPSGNHSFAVTNSGYAKAFIGNKAYRADETLPTLTLVSEASRLDTGAHYLGETLQANSAQKISIQLVAPTNMTHFRYGVAEDINKKPWLVLQSSLEIDLPRGDHPEVIIQYSMDQRQLSSLYTVAIPVQN